MANFPANVTRGDPRTLPQILNNSADRAKLQNFIDECIRFKQIIADNQESIKNLRSEAAEQVGISPKAFNILVSLFFNNNFTEKQAEYSELDQAIEMLLNNSVKVIDSEGK